MRDADLALAVRAAKPMSALADLRGFAPNRRATPAAPGLADTRRAMSAFGGEADIENVQRHVRQ